jgi:WD40 repeat protein
VWDLGRGVEIWRTEAHAVEIGGVALTADGRRAVTASRDYTFRLWDLAARSRVEPTHGHARAVNGVAFAGANVVSAGRDGTLRVWDPTRGVEKLILPVGGGRKGSAWSVAATADGDTAIVAADDGKLYFYDLVAGRQIAAVVAHRNGAYALAVTPDGKKVVSGGRDGAVHVFDIAKHKRVATLRTTGNSSVNAVAVSADGKRAASGADDRIVRLYDLVRARDANRLQGHGGLVLAAAFGDDGTLITGSEDATLRTWQTGRGAKWSMLLGHSAPVTAVAACPDRPCFVSASKDGTIGIWDRVAGKMVDRIDLNPSDDHVLSLAVSPDGKLVAAGTKRGVVLLFELLRDP